MNDGAQRVLAAHCAWLEARQQSGLQRAALVAAVEDAVAGGSSQSEIARALGWPRQRIGKLLPRPSRLGKASLT